MHQRAFARPARSHDRKHFTRANFEIDITQNLASFFVIGTIRKANILKADAARKRRQWLGPRLLFYIVLRIHELEYLRRCSQSLLEIVIEQGELSHRIIKFEHGNDEGQECSRGKHVTINLFPPEQKQQRNRNRAKNIHQRRTDRDRSHRTKISPEQPLGGFAKARNFPAFHAEGFHNAVAGNRLVQNILNVSQLVLTSPRGVPHPAPDSSRGKNYHWHEQNQNPRKLPSQRDHHQRSKNKGKELLQKFRQHTRHRVLDPLDVIHDGRNQSPGGVPGKECCRALQDRIIQIVSQVRDHSESRVVHQVRARIVTNSLQHGGGYQGKGHHRPRILKVRRNELLQINRMSASWNGK